MGYFWQRYNMPNTKIISKCTSAILFYICEESVCVCERICEYIGQVKDPQWNDNKPQTLVHEITSNSPDVFMRLFAAER